MKANGWTGRKSGDLTFPDLRSSINTNFSSLASSPHSLSADDSKSGYDFGSKYRELFQLHRLSCDLSSSTLDSEDVSEDCSYGSLNSSAPQNSFISPQLSVDEFAYRRSSAEDPIPVPVPPVWCIDCRENIVVLGCADGRLEFWEGASGRFKVGQSYLSLLLIFIFPIEVSV